MQAAAQGVPAAGDSDASDRTCVTSGWRSQWPLPSPRTMAHSDPEQVIEVPKILPLDVPLRAALRVTQLTEQLVEVPTILSYSSLLQRTVEQLVDIPVPGGGGPSFGLQGFSSGQNSTASPSSKKRISERMVEQIVDPVSSGRLHGSSSSHSPAGDEERANEPGKGGFRTFPQNKKSAKLGSHSGSDLLPESSPSTPAAQREEEVEVLLAVPIQLRTPAQRARLRELISASSQARKRGRKKRRKRRTPRTSSRSLCGRARRRQWPEVPCIKPVWTCRTVAVA